MTHSPAAAEVFRPAVPEPRTRPAGVLEFLWLSWRDPLRMWSARHFREPILYGDSRSFDLADPQWMDAAPWIRACFEETMRLFPPAPLFTRVALKDTTVANRRVPAGAAMLISPWVLHRHSRLWEDPSAFLPERFMPGAGESIDRFAYIPFGGGPRICIGAAFAMQEAMIALAVIAKGVSLEPVDEVEPLPAHRITLRPQTPIRLRAMRRDAVAAHG